MKRVAIMCRVSSEEQAKGYSLDAQLEALTKYCERHEYEIVYSIREDHSAKTFNRPEWNKWFDLIKKKKLKVDEIIFVSWDRFSRN
ncbi:MAG: recombinase family protein, partial [Crocinitomix sp.]|nr:recombinase family protein [Crocinitomix sp.]